ncbi:MAG: hypothetical protein K6U74_18130 [Firmicutes bacterium]|nr:hypothetical protein [Bacillota bacterium]
MFFKRRRIIRPRPVAPRPGPEKKTKENKDLKITAKCTRLIFSAASFAWGLLETALYLASTLAALAFAVYGVCWLMVQVDPSASAPREVMRVLFDGFAQLTSKISKIKGG